MNLVVFKYFTKLVSYSCVWIFELISDVPKREKSIKSLSFCNLAHTKKKDPFVCLQLLHVQVISTMPAAWRSGSERRF